MFCCITKSIAPGLHNTAFSTVSPTVKSEDVTITFPLDTIVKVELATEADILAFLIFGSVEALIREATLSNVAAVAVNSTQATVILSPTETVPVTEVVCITLLEEYTLYPAKFPAYPFFKAKSAKLNQS
jgi:hypothetical protein